MREIMQSFVVLRKLGDRSTIYVNIRWKRIVSKQTSVEEGAWDYAAHQTLVETTKSQSDSRRYPPLEYREDVRSMGKVTRGIIVCVREVSRCKVALTERCVWMLRKESIRSASGMVSRAGLKRGMPVAIWLAKDSRKLGK
ncbi:hypothetical protein Tco_1335325 [Tanacetum coccineum]